MKHEKPVTIKLSLLGPGQVFGCEDLINGRDYTGSLVCAANNSEIFELNKKEVFSFLKSNSECWSVLNKQCRQRETVAV